MSTLTDVIVWNHRLSIVAGEEAARFGHPEIDVDHLLLALLISDGAAGQHLRGAGLTLPGARQAVETEHAARLRGLGITAPQVAPLPLPDLTGRALDWTPRALTVLREDSRRPTDLSLLRALLAEPSGLVTAVLARLPVDQAALRSVPEDPSSRGPRRGVAGTSSWRALSQTGFVPVPVAEVWALLSDPRRRPEWDATVGAVEVVGPDTWRMAPREHRAGSSAADDRDDAAEVQLVQHHEGRLLEWESTRQGSPRGSRRVARRRGGRLRLRVELEPVTGGTRTHVTLAVPPRSGWPGVVWRVLSPLHRFLLSQLLTLYTTGISRALR